MRPKPVVRQPWRDCRDREGGQVMLAIFITGMVMMYGIGYAHGRDRG